METPGASREPISTGKHLMRRPRPGREYRHKEISGERDDAHLVRGDHLGSIGGSGCMRDHARV